jgi:hypothetical protein
MRAAVITSGRAAEIWMRDSMKIAPVTLGLAAALLIASAAPASAQSFGIGPHLSFIREHTPSNTPADLDGLQVDA